MAKGEFVFVFLIGQRHWFARFSFSFCIFSFRFASGVFPSLLSFVFYVLFSSALLSALLLSHPLLLSDLRFASFSLRFSSLHIWRLLFAFAVFRGFPFSSFCSCGFLDLQVHLGHCYPWRKHMSVYFAETANFTNMFCMNQLVLFRFCLNRTWKMSPSDRMRRWNLNWGDPH